MPDERPGYGTGRKDAAGSDGNMKRKLLSIFCLALLLRPGVSPAKDPEVTFEKTPHGGIQPQAIVDASGKLAGIVSTQDLIGYLAEYFPMEVLNLPPDLEQDQFIATREGG